MSWHCVSVRGAYGDATPYFLASASTCERYDAESLLLDDVVSAPSDVTAFSKLTRAESSFVTAGPPLPPPHPRRRPAPRLPRRRIPGRRSRGRVHRVPRPHSPRTLSPANRPTSGSARYQTRLPSPKAPEASHAPR